jgi:hypothetical protein
MAGIIVTCQRPTQAIDPGYPQNPGIARRKNGERPRAARAGSPCPKTGQRSSRRSGSRGVLSRARLQSGLTLGRRPARRTLFSARLLRLLAVLLREVIQCFGNQIGMAALGLGGDVAQRAPLSFGDKGRHLFFAVAVVEPARLVGVMRSRSSSLRHKKIAPRQFSLMSGNAHMLPCG